ncbi:thioredoxin-dependent thiol peroxidase [Picrophilus oshimae]|uniref:thioredoxin-dependent peroxiredoxin n=1 Tax=Picrophilus torridus (strain ATCC 700027 / DSM 9790 / JCM 10055 / NBRC 100828 / KAW 2/3) TaxID=1122961 RepID=Q6L1X5_PICTO|nr:thioredoxin-dependent thiol peroxidase [Picrophilus oshimae]AAT43027.1 hypothetical bacterioferritin comigratory protein [Picrophilus oshimae DSM 9789]SMD30671.1 peroxiredoxin Q/BCP [Picrophilus oshimae DSM 9789]
MELLKVGDTAPDFETVDQNGKTVKLSDFRGMPVVLYFYPKDNTPGCTVEAKNFRDNMDIFDSRVKVIGVSVDSQESHMKFHEKLNLNFDLLSDKSKEIVKKYGVLGVSTAKRVTYIIDQNGKIAHVFEKVKPDGHAKEVYEKLKELKLIN